MGWREMGSSWKAFPLFSITRKPPPATVDQPSLITIGTIELNPTPQRQRNDNKPGKRSGLRRVNASFPRRNPGQKTLAIHLPRVRFMAYYSRGGDGNTRRQPRP